MTDPLFWLVLSFFFVTVSLTIALVVAIPALKELARAARSAEKLFETLRREFPPTLEAIRLTGIEISDLTDDVSEGVQSAGQVVKQVDQSLSSVRKQAQKVHSGTRQVMSGFKAAWKTLTRPKKAVSQRRSSDRLPPGRPELEPGSASDSLANRRSPEEAASGETPKSSTTLPASSRRHNPLPAPDPRNHSIAAETWDSAADELDDR